MARNQKSLRKIKLLIVLMLITIVFLITSTYAWFSTQRDVEISGMKINVEVAESMQISLDGETWGQSIQIANMRQFYGTYTGTGDSFAIYQAKNVNDEGNENYVPTELLPVSTAGEVADGKLKFVTGTLQTNPDGTSSLVGITSCSEADFTNTVPYDATNGVDNSDATVAERQANNQSHPYLAFDMYLRNISAKDVELDDLYLNTGSRVWVNTAVADDQEGAGKTGTGLEYSSRVGMIIYGNTVSVTASDTADKTVGEQVRGITATGGEVAAIWEPNAYSHTQYVVDNNGRGINSTWYNVRTYGIKSAVAEATPNEITNINSTLDSNLVAVNTLKTDNYAGGQTGGKEYITNTSGARVGLAPNQISKVRVYIWLEGQDPDCVDLASTGDKLNVTLKLTKDKTITTDENTYTEDSTQAEEEETVAGTILTASEVRAVDYGAKVTNYTPTNGSTNGWKIFHSDNENIYLIADDYIENQYAPAGKSGSAVNKNGTYKFYFTNILSNYTGTTNIDTTLSSKWLSSYKTAGYTSTYNNAKATAYLLDTNQWAGFKDSSGYADYAIGGPTLELFADSYNRTHVKDIDVRATSNVGYKLKFNTDTEYTYYIRGLDTTESLYVISSTSKASAMWLASPSAGTANYVMSVSERGSVSYFYYSDSVLGARPIVSLGSDIQIEKQSDGTYKIIQ